MVQAITRREASKRILSVAGSSVILSFLKGCGSDLGDSISYSDSGSRDNSALLEIGDYINGRFTPDPDRILSRNDVKNTVNNLRNVIERGGGDADTILHFSRGRNPPYIAGNYEIIDGTQIIPEQGKLDLGTFRWSNQTPDNYIDTDYNQFNVGQTGSGAKGEIIRGERGVRIEGEIVDIFTVYSALHVNQSTPYGNCKTDAISLFNGIKIEEGNERGIVVTYINVPIKIYDPDWCTANSSAGVFVLYSANNRRGKSRIPANTESDIMNRAKELIVGIKANGNDKTIDSIFSFN